MSGEKANILIVDDEPANLLALEAVLGDLGQHLVRANSGEEALEKLLAGDYAAVLLDVQMRGMDGFETARLVRSRPRSRHTPIIFLTAFESPQFPLLEAYRLGAVDYLVKPLGPEILRAKVAFFVEFVRRAEELKRAE
ncbi:MAG TPA: response regulator, partial [Gemmataceae bacterium]|nr:response regulator [Gemmataceae bacterium]